MKKILVLLLAPLVLAGCNSVSNLSPARTARNGASLYTVEASFTSKQQAIIEESIRGYVVTSDKAYPMEPVPLVKGRWEGQIPVDPTQRFIHYHFQFDYKVNSIPNPVDKSYSSPEYGLDIK